MNVDEHPHRDPRAWESWQTPPGVPDTALLDLFAADAAARAAAMLAGNAATTHDPLIEPLIDAVRLIATPAGAPRTTAVARLADIPEDDLRRLALAHRRGGAAAVAAALAATPCRPDELAAAVEEARRCRTFATGELAADAGTITDPGAGVRLRLRPDGRWHPFTLARGHWWSAAGATAPAGPPTRRPCGRGPNAVQGADRIVAGSCPVPAGRYPPPCNDGRGTSPPFPAASPRA